MRNFIFSHLKRLSWTEKIDTFVLQLLFLILREFEDSCLQGFGLSVSVLKLPAVKVKSFYSFPKI